MPNPRSLLIIWVALSVAACDRSAIVQPELRSTAWGASRSIGDGDDPLYVADVDALYSAVNNPGNAGAVILLAPGTYVLSAKNGSGVARPNGGRLELQPDMSLSGVAGDRSAVVIDMAGLPGPSFNAALGKTGGIRVGRGANSIAWLTIVGNANSAANIETDLADAHPTRVTAAHLSAHGSFRGIDVRNTGAAMSGRSICR